MEALESRMRFTLWQRRLINFGRGTQTDFCYSGFFLLNLNSSKEEELTFLIKIKDKLRNVFIDF
jgi:hypothetical protein